MSRSAEGRDPRVPPAAGPALPQSWELTPRGFERFLQALDPDPAIAAERYEQIRFKLLRFFEWRGCAFPEDHADETLTRVIRKIDQGETIQDPGTYCYGVARLVLLEAHKQRAREQDAAAQFARTSSLVDEPEVERSLECLRTCLDGLSADQQTLIVHYYRNDTAERIAERKQLANTLGIGGNALRLRVHRLTERLGGCVARCLRQPGGAK